MDNNSNNDNNKNHDNNLNNDYITQCVINSIKFVSKFIHKSVNFIAKNKNQFLTRFIVCAAVGGITYITYIKIDLLIYKCNRIEQLVDHNIHMFYRFNGSWSSYHNFYIGELLPKE